MANNDRDKVKYWLPYIHETREDMGLTEKKYPDELVLSVIWEATDPKGDPSSHAEGGETYGLFGAGRRQVIALGHADIGQESAAFLHGAGKPAVQNFLRYVELYARKTPNKPYSGHDYDPELVALTWYTGPDAVEAFKKDRDGKLDALQGTLVGTRIDSNVETSFVEAAGLKLLEGYKSDFGLKADETFDLSQRSRLLSPQRRTATPALTLDIPSLGAFSEAYSSWSTGDADVSPAIRGRTPSGKFAQNIAVSLPPGCRESSIGEMASRAPLPGVKRSTIDVDRLANGQANAKAVLEYIDSNYTKSLSKFLHTSQSTESTASWWSAADTQRVRGFIDDVTRGDAAFTFQAAMFNVATTFVKPLLNAKARQAWGQRRGYAAGPRDANGKRIPLVDPATGKKLSRYHLGIDYETRASAGGLGRYQPCYAIYDGKVTRTKDSNTYGKVIYIDHGGGVSARYAHLDEFFVNVGDTVITGQVIANCGHSEGTRIGDTGKYKFERRKMNHFTPHMHFEIRFNIGYLQEGKLSGGVNSNTHNVSIDPEPLLAGAPNPGEVLEANDPIVENLKAARDAFARMATGDVSPQEAALAANSFDTTSACLRGESIYGLSRFDLTVAQAQNMSAQTSSLATNCLPTGNYETPF